nr:MAG TPA: M2 protein, BM2 protein chimera channel, TRANSPORT PROTEIN [Caudoviricetes sp.]
MLEDLLVRGFFLISSIALIAYIFDRLRGIK